MLVAEYGNPPDMGPAADLVRVKSWGLESRADPMLDVPRLYLVLSLEVEAPVSLALIAPDGQETGPSVRVTEVARTLAFPMALSAEETPTPGQYSLSLRRWIGDDPIVLDVQDGALLAISEGRIVAGAGA